MCFKGPKLEQPAPAPGPPTRDEAAGTSEADKERERLRKINASGRGGTLLTGYAGLGAPSDVEKKTLLGA